MRRRRKERREKEKKGGAEEEGEEEKKEKMTISKCTYRMNKVFSVWEGLPFHKSAHTDIFRNGKNKL